MTVRDIVMAAAGVGGAPPGPSTDPQFNYVTMLLHGDGTNGAQNNTFVDSSTNNFTITRTGTPTQGSFSPYGPLWSNYFGGAGTYLTTPSISLGSSSFTFEAWVYRTAAKATEILASGTTSGGFNIGFESTGTVIEISRYNVAYIAQVSATVPLNQWFHIAATRDGNSYRIFLNGTQVGTTVTDSNSISASAYRITDSATSGNNVTGYVSNLRLVTGTALYTSAFTPSTTPLTAVSGTSLLTCQSNRFRDNSSNNFAITVTGTPSVQRFSPFDPAAEYSTSVIGGSAYFNGSSQYLTTSSVTFSGDFTVEGWVFIANLSAARALVQIGDDLNANGPVFYVTTAGKFSIFAGSALLTGSATIAANTWVHLAVCRSGSTIKSYVNGVLDATITNSTTFTGAVRVGAEWYNGALGGTIMNGYISNLRLVTGTAVYTANFTPPTAPLTAITNTSLLLNTVNAGIFDNAMMNDLVTVGNAQVSTAVKKYGTGSMYFDGTGDCLTTPDVGLFDFGTGDFTVETWLYPTVFITDGNSIASGLGPTNGDWMMALRSSTQLSWGRNHLAWDATTSGVTFSLNTWYHVAVTKSSGTLRIFVDGVQRASVSNSQSYNVQTSLAVGARQATFSVFGPGEFFNGYIDDLRITKGVARYTSAFTPPTAALPNN